MGFTGYFRTQDGTYTGVPLTNYQIAQNYTPRRRQEAGGRVPAVRGSATRRRYEIVINTRLATLRCQTGC